MSEMDDIPEERSEQVETSGAAAVKSTPSEALSAVYDIPVQLAAVYPHKNLQDPKVRLLLDFMVERCQKTIRDIFAGR